jgi:predicted ATPase/DNA-binding CsgD family transcriptional regulator
MTSARGTGTAVRVPAIWVPLTSFVGRAADVDALVRLIDGARLVTVTGTGGVGKTRLASEVVQRVEGQFPDGVWFIGLSAIADGTQVPTEVMAALGVQQVRGRAQLEVLAETLAPRRLLLVLDNCEHVLPTVTDLAKALLTRGDEVRILATSREPLGIGGERQYRLSPLGLPSPGPHEAAGQSEAETLFTERAGQADARSSAAPDDARLVARVVARLDGIPLAIELAAARVEALGMTVLADRIDDALRLPAGNDRLATDRHRSLTAVADWSYQLLSEPERRVFRQLAMFPGPFTLEAAEAVAGADAAPAVLRLVDCSLLVPPRPGVDQRLRYTMLETLKAYGLMRLREGGEERETMAALAGFAEAVAGQAAAGLDTAAGELEAARWLDAEDATISRALAWELAHVPEDALRLAATLAPWWWLRGRLAEAYERLTAAAAPFSPASEAWVTAQLWLGHLAAFSVDPAEASERYTAVLDAYKKRCPTRALLEALVVTSVVRSDLSDVPGAAQAARWAAVVGGGLGGTAAELLALTAQTVSAYRENDNAGVLDCARRAESLLQQDIPGYLTRWCRYILSGALTAVGELDSARRVCAPGVAHARQVDDQTTLVALLGELATVERLAGRVTEAQECLREAVAVALRIGMRLRLADLIVQAGHLAAATGQWADAVTLWAAYTADRKRVGEPTGSVYHGRRSRYLPQIEQALSPDQRRDAEERGFNMTVAAAAEHITMLIDSDQRESSKSAPASPLSPRERELVTLVAQGHTNAEIAARLRISVRTVSSHLDRIRDKTGQRRRADLTRLALAGGLV